MGWKLASLALPVSFPKQISHHLLQQVSVPPDPPLSPLLSTFRLAVYKMQILKILEI